MDDVEIRAEKDREDEQWRKFYTEEEFRELDKQMNEAIKKLREEGLI